MTNDKRIISGSWAKAIAICLAIAIIAMAALLWRFDPSQTAWMPKCWWHALTGLQCPSCGNTRAVHALLHAQWEAAWLFNPFLWVSIPILGALAWLLIKKPASAWLPRLAMAYAVMALAWWIVRNL